MLQVHMLSLLVACWLFGYNAVSLADVVAATPGCLIDMRAVAM
jgi:hypothetical protein